MTNTTISLREWTRDLLGHHDTVCQCVQESIFDRRYLTPSDTLAAETCGGMRDR